MGALGSKLRTLEGGMVTFWCPGCREPHMLRVRIDGAERPSWTFNGNGDAPTFQPSVLVTSGCKTPQHKEGDSCWCTYNAEHPNDPAPFACGVCHSFVTDGQIRFLNDSTHELAGKTVPLPDYPKPEENTP